MPLSTSIKREPMHHREINCYSYLREDGLWDIEGHLVDTKSYKFDNHDRGTIEPGTPLHEMWLRLTLDDEFMIHDVEAVTDWGPFNICPAIVDNYKKLIGLQIKSGWRRSVQKAVGGVNGCTHLVDLLTPIAITAFQTIYPLKTKELNNTEIIEKPSLLSTCHAYATDSPVVERLWPKHFISK
ncbi:MAG: DUF2889 domain-containing protein [Methylococcales bacterium]